MLKTLTPRRIALLGGYGIALLAVSPIGEQGADRSLTLHMVQHVILVSVAAPLVAIGTRLPEWMVVDSQGRRRALWLFAWPIAWVLMWLWHVPRLYDAALGFAPLHAFEHAALFISWVLGWASIVRASDCIRPVRTSLAVALLGITALQSTVLGALLAFSGKPWFDYYSKVADPLLDQRVGGTFMSVAMGPTQLLVVVWLIIQWFDEAERDQIAIESSAVVPQKIHDATRLAGAET